MLYVAVCFSKSSYSTDSTQLSVLHMAYVRKMFFIAHPCFVLMFDFDDLSLIFLLFGYSGGILESNTTFWL